MRSLYESIIGSNNASIFDAITDILKNDSEKDLEKIKKLWARLGLDVEGCQWEYDDDLHEIYYGYDSWVLLSKAHRLGWDFELTNESYLGKQVVKKRIKELTDKLKSIPKITLDDSHSMSPHVLGRFK